jgi:predicted nucleic-acid-binding Zn-ribbon protein
MGFEERILETFQCQKCRGKAGVIQKVSLPTSSFPKLFLNAGKYCFVTCSLCGYTEIYDMAIYVKSEEKVKKDSSLTQEA